MTVNSVPRRAYGRLSAGPRREAKRTSYPHLQLLFPSVSNYPCLSGYLTTRLLFKTYTHRLGLTIRLVDYRSVQGYLVANSPTITTFIPDREE